MEFLGQFNGREIYYFPILAIKGWADQLPTKNWLALIMVNTKNLELCSHVADVCIDKNVLYMCSVGEACEYIHDVFDETIVGKKIDAGESVESEDDFENSPMTVWDYDFDSGAWFALNSAFHDTKDIDKIICMDLNEKVERQRLVDLIEKIKTGFIPPDNELC